MQNLTTSLRMRGLLSALLIFSAWAPLGAQNVEAEAVRMWPVDSVLARFEADIRAHVVNSVGSFAVFRILELPDSYAARQDSLLDGLERLALTSGNPHVRHIAAGRIAFAGEIRRTGRLIPGVSRRLVRIYRAQEDLAVRLTIRNRLPFQADRRAAAALLRSIAAAPDSSGGMGPHGYFSPGDPRTEALARLAEMGEEGRAVLQAMHRSGEARSPQARIILENMARRGFPVRDLARMQP